MLTSFDIWEAHHITNSSDDLLAAVVDQHLLPKQAHFLRKVPVDFQVAPAMVIAQIQALEPDVVICCGMAETRELLTVESNGKCGDVVLETAIDVHQLVAPLSYTKISHDAGKFVCNHLYYSVLKYCQERELPDLCLFVHVPPLNAENRSPILSDFMAILQAVCQP